MQIAATDGIAPSEGSGRIAFEASAETLPGVSAPSSVVRSVMRTARSSANTLDSRLIERLARVPARSSTATWSIEPIRGSRGSSGSSKPVGSAGACAITLSVSPSPRLAVPREEDVRGRAQVVADGIRIPEGVVAARGEDDDRADAGVVCAANVVRGVADLDGSVRRPTARPFAGDPHEGAALLGVAAERALSQAKEAFQAELLHAGSCHRLRVSGEEGQLNTRLRQP